MEDSNQMNQEGYDGTIQYSQNYTGDSGEQDKRVPVKLFVGQIPKAWEESDILDFFRKFGDIEETNIIRDTQHNHRGCAFVKFSSLTEADVTIASLNESCFLPGSSAKLQLKWADGEEKRLGLFGLTPKNANKLFVTNFPSETTEEQLKEVFSMHGEVRRVHIVKDEANPANNRCYLQFKTKEQALIAKDKISGKLKVHAHPLALQVVFAEHKRDMLTQPYNTGQNYDMMGEQGNMQVIWFEYKDENGVPYYFNSETNETQWEKPRGVPIQEGMPIPVQGEDQGGASVQTNNNGGLQGALMQEGSHICISGIPPNWTEYELGERFKQYGSIIGSRIVTVSGGKFGVVTYDAVNAAKMAIDETNGKQVQGYTLIVAPYYEGYDPYAVKIAGGSKVDSSKIEALLKKVNVN